MFLLYIFRLVPFSLLYGLSDIMAFFLYRVIGYRKKVILHNLQRSFPEKSTHEIARLVKETYKNLTDVTLETIKSFSTPISEIDRRAICVNPYVVNQYLDQGQSIILVGSHLCNWEYSGLSMPPCFHGDTLTVYKPLSNKKMDTFLNRSRARTGAQLVAMDDVFKTMRKRAEGATPAIFLMLADQSPSSRKSAHWVNFLGQDTASLPGVDVLGRKFEFPVVYYRVMRTQRRGFYEIEFSELCNNPSDAQEMEITRAYANRLEADIKENPGHWLWSHKRWKMTR